MASNKNPPARARGWAWAACALLGTAAALASAATLQISPVSIDLAANEPGAAFTLRNPGATPLYGQLRVFEWDQQRGEDVLTPARNLAASPPLLEVPPGSEQLVRIVKTGAVGEAKEAAYRILIDEIQNEQAAPQNGVRILMRYSVPVFVDNGLSAADKPRVEWSVAQKDGRWRLTAENRGAKRARISQVWLKDAQGRRHLLADGLLGYALAGRHHSWELDLPAGVRLDTGASIEAVVNTDPVSDRIGEQPPRTDSTSAARR